MTVETWELIGVLCAANLFPLFVMWWDNRPVTPSQGTPAE